MTGESGSNMATKKPNMMVNKPMVKKKMRQLANLPFVKLAPYAIAPPTYKQSESCVGRTGAKPKDSRFNAAVFRNVRCLTTCVMELQT